jgi:hypothetical protein
MLNNQDNIKIPTDSGEITFNSKIKAKPQLNLDKNIDINEPFIKKEIIEFLSVLN